PRAPKKPPTPPVRGDQYGARRVLKHPASELLAPPIAAVREAQGAVGAAGMLQDPRQVASQAVVDGHAPANLALIAGRRRPRPVRPGAPDGARRELGGFQGLGDALARHGIAGPGGVA